MARTATWKRKKIMNKVSLPDQENPYLCTNQTCPVALTDMYRSSVGSRKVLTLIEFLKNVSGRQIWSIAASLCCLLISPSWASRESLHDWRKYIFSCIDWKQTIHVEAHLQRLGLEINQHIKGLFKDCFLQFICFSSTHDATFFKGSVAAKMRKEVTYKVDLWIDQHGLNEECYCECASRSGPISTCSCPSGCDREAQVHPQRPDLHTASAELQL